MQRYVFELIGMGSKKYGGFEKYIVEEARQLKDIDYILVVIFDREPLATDYINDLKQIGAKIEILPQISRIGFIKGFLKLLRTYHPEVVHTNFSSNIFMALPLARFFGVKKRIATEHCLPTIHGVKSRMQAQLMTIFADYVLPVSQKSSDALASGVTLFKSKICTLYLGIPSFSYDKSKMRQRLSIQDDTFALMNIAYHHPVKGVDILLEAMAILVKEKKYNNMVLYQIGGSHTEGDTDKLRRLASDLAIDNNIVWLGLRNDVPMLLTAGDLYIQPSRSEGVPLSIMEADMARLPIAATNVGGNSEAAIDGVNATVVPPENPIELANAIEKLYLDASMRSRYGNMGHEIATQKFNIQTSVNKLIKCYYSL